MIKTTASTSSPPKKGKKSGSEETRRCAQVIARNIRKETPRHYWKAIPPLPFNSLTAPLYTTRYIFTSCVCINARTEEPHPSWRAKDAARILTHEKRCLISRRRGAQCPCCTSDYVHLPEGCVCIHQHGDYTHRKKIRISSLFHQRGNSSVRPIWFRSDYTKRRTKSIHGGQTLSDGRAK